MHCIKNFNSNREVYSLDIKIIITLHPMFTHYYNWININSIEIVIVIKYKKSIT